MAGDKLNKIEYIDNRKIFIPKLFMYKNGIKLPTTDNILKVTEKEKLQLMKMRNGKNICWKEINDKMNKEENLKNENKKSQDQIKFDEV